MRNLSLIDLPILMNYGPSRAATFRERRRVPLNYNPSLRAMVDATRGVVSKPMIRMATATGISGRRFSRLPIGLASPQSLVQIDE